MYIFRFSFTILAVILGSFQANCQQNTPVAYCIPGTFCFSNNNYSIGNVKFAGINNFSACVNNGYADYTQAVAAAVINAGTAVPVSVAINNGTASYVALWIDYNQDNVFDSTEYTYVGYGGTASGNVLVPASALGGTTRMRVRNSVSNMINPPDACRVFIYSETEEYSVNIQAAKISIVYQPAFADTLYQDNISITARINCNATAINNTDSLRPRLWAKKYGSPTWQSFAGALISGNTVSGNWQFNIPHPALGIRKNGCDSVLYYLTAQDTAVNFTTAVYPFTGALHNSVNIQVTVPTTPFGYRLKPRLRDTVYVSTSNCRYQSLTTENGLFKAISERGLEGDLTVIIESDLQENGLYDLQPARLNGHRLLIRPDRGDSVRRISNILGFHPLFNFNGVKGVTIDGSYNDNGRHLAMNYQSDFFFNDTAAIIKIFNSCDSITIKNIDFSNSTYSSYAGESSVWLAHGNNRNILVSNCFFRNLNTRLPGRYISSVAGNNQAIIRNNQFVNFGNGVLYADSFSTHWIIDSNHFYRSPSVKLLSSSDLSIINMAGQGHRIAGNYFGGSQPFCAGTPLYFSNHIEGVITAVSIQATSGNDTTVITGNRISNIVIDTKAASEFCGISIYSNNTRVQGNTIGYANGTDTAINCLANSIFGVKRLGVESVDISDNVIASLRNVSANLSANVEGILSRNNANGGFATNAPSRIANNRIYNLANYSNANYPSSGEQLGGTMGIDAGGGTVNTITGNTIYNLTCNQNKVSGIVYFGSGNNSFTTISRNRIYKLINLAQTYCCDSEDYMGDMINGIGFSDTNDTLFVVNNEVSLNNNNTAADVGIKGIYALAYPQVPGKQYVAYNSVYIGGTSANNAGSACYAVRSSAVKRIANNIFYNERSGGTGAHMTYKVYSTSPEQVLSNTIVSNNFYVLPDSSAFNWWGWTPKQAWSTWKAEIRDSSSYLAFPADIPANDLFEFKDTANLSIKNNNPLCWAVNGKGLPIADVAGDFDSDHVRSVTITQGASDIGADEFNTSTLPIPLVIYGRHALNGADTLATGNRIMAIIRWGNTGTLPVLDSCRWYSGDWVPDSSNGGNASGAGLMNGWWQLKAHGGSGYSYTLSLFHDSSSLGKIGSITGAVIYKKKGAVAGTWEMLFHNSANDQQHAISADSIQSFSSFVTGNMKPALAYPAVKICAGNATAIKTHLTGAGYTYRWQKKTGNIFTDLVPGTVYTGVSDSVLHISSGDDSLSGSIYRCISNNGGNLLYSIDYLLKVASNWTGTADSNWNNALNWSCGQVPGAHAYILINADTPNAPVINTPVSCFGLDLEEGSTITVGSGGSISVTGH